MAKRQPAAVPRRVLFGVGVPVTLLVAALLWYTLDKLQPLPPRRIVMATGSKGSGYDALGEKYRAMLARRGIEVELRRTDGDVENLALLNDPNSGVDVGFLVGGLTSDKASPHLMSIGSLFYQPLWLFYRGDKAGATGSLRDLSGLRVALGAKASGTRAIMHTLLAQAAPDVDQDAVPPSTYDEAADMLLAGKIDAAAMLTTLDSPAVQKLLKSPAVRLMSLGRIDAFVALNPQLDKVLLPAGAIDMVANIPAADVPLLAATSNLVVREHLHPVLQVLFAGVSERLLGQPTLFNRDGRFPAATSSDLPLSVEAKEYYKSGRPLTMRYLPFWLAAIVERLLDLLLPLLGVLYPLFRFAPTIYGYLVQRKILQIYKDLRGLENDALAAAPPSATQSFQQRLDDLERRARGMQLPASYTPQVYSLCGHIDAVRQKLQA